MTVININNAKPIWNSVLQKSLDSHLENLFKQPYKQDYPLNKGLNISSKPFSFTS